MTDSDDILPLADTKTEKALDIGSLLVSPIPLIGGALSNVFGQISSGRKMKRVHDFLNSLVTELEELKSETTKSYVETEDFEDILERTLNNVGKERNEAKRTMYKYFLINSIKSPERNFDEHICLLKTLEDIQIDCFMLIKALTQIPKNVPDGLGSPINTLRRRLPEINEIRIPDLISQLNNLRITNIININQTLVVTMSANGAEDLRHHITPYGKRFLKFLEE